MYRRVKVVMVLLDKLISRYYLVICKRMPHDGSRNCRAVFIRTLVVNSSSVEEMELRGMLVGCQKRGQL